MCWHWPIFPVRRRTSIFGSAQLNFCVRNGYRWTLCDNNTNYTEFSVISSFDLMRSSQYCILLVHLRGLEPRTHWLRVSCSTNWARGAYGILFPWAWKMLIKNRTRKKNKGNSVVNQRYVVLNDWTVKSSSSFRSISIGQLNTLLYLHLRPIKLVVYKWPYQLNVGDI